MGRTWRWTPIALATSVDAGPRLLPNSTLMSRSIFRRSANILRLRSRLDAPHLTYSTNEKKPRDKADHKNKRYRHNECDT